MFHPISAFIAWRYSTASKQNSFVSFINRFSVAGIALGLMALIVVVSVMNGFEAQLKSRILGLVPHIVVAHDEGVSQQTLARLNNVKKVTPFLEAQGVLQSRNGLRGIQIQGVVAADMQQSILADNMQLGQIDTLTQGSFRVVISKALGRQLQIGVGDKVRLLMAGASVYTPFGRLPSQRLVTVAGVHNVGSRLDEKFVFMPVDDLKRMMRKSTQSPADYRLFLNEPFAYQSTVAQLDQAKLSSENWRTRQGPLFDAVKMEGNMMFLMLVLIIAVAAFNIVSALVMVVSEKQGDIAILQTQGLGQYKLMTIFMLNGVFNGVRGAAIGLVLGVVVALTLNDMLEWLGVSLALSADGTAVPVDIRWPQVATYTLLSLGLCFIASLYPAYRAMQTQPATALQNE
ncbi:lipoprotein-releasing ABC transporter permease subunit [Salinimonas chungwhensis]|uniref:lipoprotein-releasing ABC transporter permease subunit n=1 Tax=Salinimonas chungwhensis TaxID=265425 RepID=UPI00036ED567|nr:lipoprotein-releasing ABC transporter permease subunit [Salinimonas chungwhensis]